MLIAVLQAALDTAVQSDKAPPLFDQAADKFQEVSAHGVFSSYALMFPFLRRKRTSHTGLLEIVLKAAAF